MSVWTHINGNIRVDGIGGLTDEPDFGEILGKVTNYYDEETVETILPEGSEGSLDYNVWKNPRKHDVFTYSVSIFGDLRDYEDVDYIERWFDEVCKKLWIRQASLQVEVEWGEKVLLYWDDDKEKVIRINY